MNLLCCYKFVNKQSAPLNKKSLLINLNGNSFNHKSLKFVLYTSFSVNYSGSIHIFQFAFIAYL